MWKTIDRITPTYDPKGPPLLSDAVREKIRSFFPRYETKRAALLPALHVVQDALGHVPPKAMLEIAEVLEIHPSDVMDTVTFYTHFWTHSKGEKVVTVCRSISCELLGAAEILQAIKERLGIDEHETTQDGRYSLVTEECLAGCDHAPCLLVNERLHKRVKVGDVDRILRDEANADHGLQRSNLYDAPVNGKTVDGNGQVETPDDDDVVGPTSDVNEMREAD